MPSRKIQRSTTKLVKSFFLIFCCTYSILIKSQTNGIGITSGGITKCADGNSGFISVTGYGSGATILYWQSSINGGLSWTNIPNTLNIQSYSSSPQYTCYRVVAQNGALTDTSTISCVKIYAPSVGGMVSGGGTFCGASSSGTLYLTGNTGDVVNWQYSINNGTSWTSITNTTTILSYSNNTQNTLYEAIVQNGVCLTDTSSQVFFYIVAPTVAGNVLSSDSVCYGLNKDTLRLLGNTGNILKWVSSADNGVTWTSISDTTTSFIYSGLTQTTWYKAIVQNQSCTADSSGKAVITVLIPLIATNAGPDATINSGESITLQGTGSGTPFWINASSELSNPSIFNPVAHPSASTFYILSVTDSHACISMDTVLITVNFPEDIGIVSNVLTPNGDGINDSWYIEDILYFPHNEVVVYNIYGNEVFRKKEYKNDWQGTYKGATLPDGTYFYIIILEDSNKIIKGSLDILKNK